jgi:hypothetical protein
MLQHSVAPTGRMRNVGQPEQRAERTTTHEIRQPDMAKKKAATGTGNSLVIVESPAKARTIGKFLGPSYTIEASIGHIRDLPQGAKEMPEQYKGEDWAYLGVNVKETI